MYLELEIAQIIPNPNQPRKFFDEEAHKELSASIRENGLLQPVVVRPVEGEEAPYMIVAGERRWRASKDAELATVPTRVLEDVSEEQAFVLSISENVNRADMTILEEAGAYADLAALGWNPKKIAGKFGKTETHIKWRLGLLTLRPEVAEWVNEGKIKPNLAWHIAQLSAPNQIIAAMRYLKGDFDSEADASNFAQGLRMAEQQVSLVTEEAPNEEEKEKREKAKKQTKDKLAKVDEVLMPLLDELTKVKPEELATILGAELGRYVREIDRLANKVTLARRVLRQANGIAQAREVAWNSALEEVETKADEPAAPEAPAQPEPESKPEVEVKEDPKPEVKAEPKPRTRRPRGKAAASA
ncbi:ParB/RepB/Spo0J family partition protein [Streptomyces ipomoeae]|uniref:ParB/RepB/Spo0J family partition protein n=1 Tax=Streptomyces ipomoeae TaxID=103232 RepID=A0AAE8W1E2_9ACTN|nr:ParB/RepB/Spo0J family partition protein [Streptomyces ipomoeae]TQE30929.1 ParB/RepB/Spo0J family partition protein [Streptomyces ipomoeae]